MPRVIEGDKNLTYLFLQPINSPQSQVWYNRNRVSVKSLSALVKSIGEKSGIAGNFSNKSLCNTCVTRMSLGQVPREVGMLVTGHKWVSSYDTYDMSSEVRMVAAQEILSQPYDEAGKLKNYGQVLEKKLSNFCENVECGGSSSCADTTLKCVSIGSMESLRKEKAGVSVQSCDVTGGNVGPDLVGTAQSRADVTVGGGKKGADFGVFGVPYKLGDDLTFDEEMLSELPVESARALGIISQSVPARGVSVFPLCIMNNCVVNVYVGKDIVAFGK